MIILRGIFTLGALSVMVLTRYRIGENAFAPWSNKPYGKSSKEKFKSTAPVRLVMIFFLYIWVRLFWILQMMSIANYERGLNISFIEAMFENFFYKDYEFIDYIFLPGSFVDGTYLFWLSYLVPIAGLFHFFNLNFYDQKNELPEPLSLGRSWLFQDILRQKDDVTIWSLFEPLLLIIIGINFLLFKGDNMWWFAMFLWIAAVFMMIQGFARYSRERQDIAFLKHSERKSRKLAERLKRKRDQSSENDNNTAIPI